MAHTLESLGALTSRHLYWLKTALTEASFQWKKQNDPTGNTASPFDPVYAALPNQTDPIVDACGFRARHGARASGLVPRTGIPYFWLGAEAEALHG